MTTINTSNALGAKVIRHLPFNGTEGEIVGGGSVALGPGGSYVNDATNGWRLVGSGADYAAAIASLGLSAHKNVTIRFYASISSTQSDGALFSTPSWDGEGGGFVVLYNASKITVGVSGHGRGAVYEFAMPTRDTRHLFEFQFETYPGADQNYASLWINGAKINHSSRSVFSTGFASNTGISDKQVHFLGWAEGADGKGYMEDFTVFQGLTDAERTSLRDNPDQIFSAPTVAAPTVSAPAIIGTPQVGVASSYTPGAVTGSPTPTVTQQWTLGGVDINGATGATYTPVAGDATKALRVRQIATNSQGSVNATSAPATVAAAGAPPASGSRNLVMTNAVYGTGIFGQALTGGYGTVNPSPVPADKTKAFYISFRFKRGSANAGAKNVLFSQPGVATAWIDGTGNPQHSLSSGQVTASNMYNFFDNNWHYCVLIFGADNHNAMYIDGEGVWGLIMNRATHASYNPTASPFVIGAEAGGANPFGGAIDMVTVGLGDPGTAVPQGPTNTKQPGLLAVYAFDGNGLDTAGTAGTLPNGDLTTSDLQGQRLVLSGTSYNGVTKGKAYIFPAATNPGGAQHKSVDMVIVGSTWTATFEGIVPGNYGSKKMDFFNDANEGVSLTAEGFSIIPISGGGDLSSSVSGGTLAPTTLTLDGPNTVTVNVPQTFAVSTDNPLTGSDTKTVALSSPNGTFTPNQVTLSAANGSVDVQYTATAAGSHALTASTTGLASATKGVTAATAGVPPTPAPTITIATADGNILAGATASISGAVNTQGDAAASVTVFADPQPSGEPVSLGAAFVSNGLHSKQTPLAVGDWKLRVVVSANGQTAQATTGVLTVLDMTGTVGIPVA